MTRTIHDETVYTGVRLVMNGSDIVAIGGALKTLGCHKIEPARHQIAELRDALSKCNDIIDAYEQNLMAHGDEPSADDDHAQAIAAGAADFMAFRDARGGL